MQYTILTNALLIGTTLQYIPGLPLVIFMFFLQIYDAGEVFGIMQYQQEDDEDEGNGQDEEKKNNPSPVISCKVVVTRENGLQASEPTR